MRPLSGPRGSRFGEWWRTRCWRRTCSPIDPAANDIDGNPSRPRWEWSYGATTIWLVREVFDMGELSRGGLNRAVALLKPARAR